MSQSFNLGTSKYSLALKKKKEDLQLLSKLLVPQSIVI